MKLKIFILKCFMRILINERQETILKEELLKAGNRDVYRNPKNLKNFPEYLRGIVTSNGDLYIVDKVMSHEHLFQILYAYGFVKTSNYLHHELNRVIPVERHDGENRFYLSYSYSPSNIIDFFDDIVNVFMAAKEKNPHLEFVTKRIDDYLSDEDYQKKGINVFTI